MWHYRSHGSIRKRRGLSDMYVFGSACVCFRVNKHNQRKCNQFILSSATYAPLVVTMQNDCTRVQQKRAITKENERHSRKREATEYEKNGYGKLKEIQMVRVNTLQGIFNNERVQGQDTDISQISYQRNANRTQGK